jgi:hypothetical protein
MPKLTTDSERRPSAHSPMRGQHLPVPPVITNDGIESIPVLGGVPAC